MLGSSVIVYTASIRNLGIARISLSDTFVLDNKHQNIPVVIS